MFEKLLNDLSNQLQTNQFLTGGVILGAITTILYSLKSVPKIIWQAIHRKFYYTVTVEQLDDMYKYLQQWLNANYEHQLRSVRASFYRVKQTNEDEEDDGRVHSTIETSNSIKKNAINFHHYNDSFTIFYGYRVIFISNVKEKLDNANSPSNVFFDKYIIAGVFAKKAINQLIQEVVKYNLSLEKKENPKVFGNMFNSWRNKRNTSLRDIDNIFLPNQNKELLLSDIESFISNRDFYTQRGIPYRRSYLLYGPPGTGKSSLISAISKKLYRDIYSMNMKAFDTESDFISMLHEIRPNSILLIEDIDSNFKGRETLTKIDFSTFLNEMSGVSCRQDILVFITTNHRDELDAALVRSGRIDLAIEIGYAELNEVDAYFKYFFGYDTGLTSLPDNIVMADIENICVRNKYNYNQAVRDLYSLVETKLNTNGKKTHLH